jgi:hypothetical protein
MKMDIEFTCTLDDALANGTPRVVAKEEVEVYLPNL